MIGPLRIAVLLIAMSTSLLAQDRAVIRIGPALGYRYASVDVTAEVAPGQSTERSASALLPGYALTGGVQIPILSSMDVTAGLELLWNTGTASDRFTVPIIVDQEQQSATIRRDHQIAQTLVIPSLGATVHLDQRTHLTLSAAVAVPIQQQLSASDVFESPSGGTFVSSGTSSRALQNAAFADGPAISYGAVGVSFSRDLPLSAHVAIAPYLRGRAAITSALSAGSWYPWEIGAGIDLCFDLSPDPEPRQPTPETRPVPVVVQRMVVDTITVVDAYDPQRTDTLWTRTERVRDSLVQGALVDTMIVTTLARVFRHLPGPPPFLSVILDVDTEDEVVDTIAALRIGVECVSDTTTTTRVSITLDQNVIWNEMFSGGSFSRTVLLANVVPAMDEREQMALTVRAVATDAVGQILEAVPRTVTLQRARSGRTFVREP